MCENGKLEDLSWKKELAPCFLSSLDQSKLFRLLRFAGYFFKVSLMSHLIGSETINI